MAVARSECGNGIMMWFCKCTASRSRLNFCRCKEAKHTYIQHTYTHTHTQIHTVHNGSPVMNRWKCLGLFSVLMCLFKVSNSGIQLLESKAELLPST